MYNKFLPSLSIIILSALSSVATSNMLYYILPQEAIAQTTQQRNDNVNKMLTYENSTYGIRMQYPSDWHKEENVSSASDKNSTLVDVVKFNQYANDTINDIGQDFKIIELDTNSTLGGNPAFKLVYTGIEEGVNLQAMLILTIKGDKAYIISYNAEPTEFSFYLPTLLNMIKSFQITE